MKMNIKKLIGAGLSVVLTLSLIGCGNGSAQRAEVNPDTPVEDVTFPLKEEKELSLLPVHRQLQHRNQMISLSSRDWKTDERSI